MLNNSTYVLYSSHCRRTVITRIYFATNRYDRLQAQTDGKNWLEVVTTSLKEDVREMFAAFVARSDDKVS